MHIWKRFILFEKRTRSRFSLFAKINCLIVLLFIPIIIMYTYSNNVTYNVVSKELQISNTKQLTFLASQIDSRINQMMDFSLILSRDPNVRAFNGLNIWDDRYDQMQTRYAIQEKMVLQSGVTDIWNTRYAVYSQQNQDVIANYNRSSGYDEDYLKRNMSGQWTYGDQGAESQEGMQSFYWFYTDSLAQPGMLTGSNLVIEASFSYENIQNMLDTYKAGGQGDPFLYHKGNAPIMNRSADSQLSEELIQYLDTHSLEDTTQDVVKLNGKKYLVSAVKSSYLDWHLVDVVPLYQILQPISLSRNLFYLFMTLLFVVGISASILLYRNIQSPIKKLIQGLRRVQRGDYSVRLHSKDQNEFSFLFHRFNDMSHQIQDLIENVFHEKIRAKEATLKQLQAQINPHFLYNCLGYIINMAQMKDEQAVVSMAHNLSAYYRYTTRMERETSSLRDEIKLLINYLDIQKLRNGRIEYHIDIPEDMLAQSVPRLMLQPMVENSVIHGVAKSYSSGEIRITGESVDGFGKIYIDDDGPGLSSEQYEALNLKMQEPLQEEMGCGLWNTNQRIMHLFGSQSHLQFGPSPLGGFRTEIVWEMPKDDTNSE
ncbi:cache domain-containing sensor histidine kinase [Paenibacillus sp. 7523-1]|uniref:cache domain-containing sensor histidine kinase n=1 Tax=Paenibacillus sp. 7523-1 TaxID=2022550 RepID=UPI000BA4E841|nr:sensor histidine kinase [Paenibacillus sp. 7523-1]PAD30017.1 two-component sensor histidine kinase [Paenibacillus sp. 7523-1]